MTLNFVCGDENKCIINLPSRSRSFWSSFVQSWDFQKWLVVMTPITRNCIPFSFTYRYLSWKHEIIDLICFWFVWTGMLLVTYHHKRCLMGSTLIPCKGKLQVGPCHCNVHSFVCMDSVAGYLNVCFGVDNCCTSFAALKCNYYHSLMRIGNNWLCLSVCIYVYAITFEVLLKLGALFWI